MWLTEKKVYNIKAADTINVRDLVSSEERRKRPLLAEVLRKTVGGCERDSMGGWDFDGWKGEEGTMQVRRKVQKRPQTRMNITQSGNRKKTNLVGTKCSYSWKRMRRIKYIWPRYNLGRDSNQIEEFGFLLEKENIWSPFSKKYRIRTSNNSLVHKSNEKTGKLKKALKSTISKI